MCIRDRLKATNESLISTLDEVMAIQREGREKRQAAEAELRNMEQELKGKLLQMCIRDRNKVADATTYELLVDGVVFSVGDVETYTHTDLGYHSRCV